MFLRLSWSIDVQSISLMLRSMSSRTKPKALQLDSVNPLSCFPQQKRLFVFGERRYNFGKYLPMLNISRKELVNWEVAGEH